MCVACGGSCLYCYPNPQTCYTCASGTFLNSSSLCQRILVFCLFPLTAFVFSACDHGCATCTNSPSQCTGSSCSGPRYHFDQVCSCCLCLYVACSFCVSLLQDACCLQGEFRSAPGVCSRNHYCFLRCPLSVVDLVWLRSMSVALFGLRECQHNMH